LNHELVQRLQRITVDDRENWDAPADLFSDQDSHFHDPEQFIGAMVTDDVLVDKLFDIFDWQL
jgi:hypothetical protein